MSEIEGKPASSLAPPVSMNTIEVMNEKNRLFVFERKEVVLLVFFFLIMTTTAFVLGMKMGKGRALAELGYTEDDVKQVELQSAKEEYVEEMLAKEDVAAKVEEDSDLEKRAFKKLQEEFEKLDAQDGATGKSTGNAGAAESNNQASAAAGNTDAEKSDSPQSMLDQAEKSLLGKASGDLGDESAEPVAKKSPTNNAAAEQSATKVTDTAAYMGKFTIQLGSYKNLEDAKKFAEGFSVRGYRPIINEVELRGRGTWYRVSLGVFDSVNSAKAYVRKEDSLFNSQEFVISQIK